MVYGSEKPITRRTRVVIVAVLWLIVGIPLLIGLWLGLSWWSLLLVVPAVWATWDYIKRGDQFGAVDRATREGKFLPDAFDDDR